MEKKEYETPKVVKVEIDYDDRIIAAGCTNVPGTEGNNCEGFGEVNPPHS